MPGLIGRIAGLEYSFLKLIVIKPTSWKIEPSLLHKSLLFNQPPDS